jgi:hypothetical protein
MINPVCPASSQLFHYLPNISHRVFIADIAVTRNLEAIAAGAVEDFVEE